MRRRNRRKRGGGAENHERWLITYADLITLLMIFFVVMFAMSKVDESKFDSLVVSLQQVFQPSALITLDNAGGAALQPRPEAEDKRNSADDKRTQAARTREAARMEQQQLDELKQRVESFVQGAGLDGKINVLDTAKGVQITLNDAALFDSGRAELKDSAQQVLGGIAPFLGLVSNPVAVEGHTDNRPIANERYASNWELSSQRAVNVVKFFEVNGVAHNRLQAIGLADTVPLAANDSEVNQASNRRVNLVVLRKYPAPSISPLDQNVITP